MEISAPHGRLEAQLDEPAAGPRAAAVLCHPHPQYGGTMHTRALYHLARSLNEAGVATLRFNFRGVGTSTGDFDGGEGERRDVGAALRRLREEYPERPTLVGGFSFGAAVGLSVAAQEETVEGLIGMALPVTLYDFTFLQGETRPHLVLQGEEDPLGSPADVREAIGDGGSRRRLIILSGTGHRFQGADDALRTAVVDFFREGPGEKLLSPA